MENKDSIERKNKGTYFLFDCPNKNDTLCKTDQAWQWEETNKQH